MTFARQTLLALLLPLLCAALPALAEQSRPSTSGLPLDSSERFEPFGDNYVIYNTMRNNGWARHDESALRAHFSLKYTLCGPQLVRRTIPEKAGAGEARSPTFCPKGPTAEQIELFAAYTGEFDFYANTRNSGPVINRVSNPAFFARAPLHLVTHGDPASNDSIELGIEHRSDGQVTDVTAPRDVERARAAYAAGDRYFFDTVSRGANLVSVALDQFDAVGVTGLELRTKLRLYINQDSAITWGPLADRGRRFSDYDRVQLRAGYSIEGFGRCEITWRVGDKGLSTSSVTLGWQAPSKWLPIYARAHFGPMNTLSNYTQRQDSIGIGLRFTNFGT